MHVQGVMTMTIGEWSMIAKAWNKAHAEDGGAPPFPTEAEFDAAFSALRGDDYGGY